VIEKEILTKRRSKNCKKYYKFVTIKSQRMNKVIKNFSENIKYCRNSCKNASKI